MHLPTMSNNVCACMYIKMYKIVLNQSHPLSNYSAYSIDYGAVVNKWRLDDGLMLAR